MINSLESLKALKELSNISDDEIIMMDEAVESLIRSYTHNNFQNRNVRAVLSSSNGKLDGIIQYLNEGDTIQINNSINEGLYVVKSIDTSSITLNKALYDCDKQLITKVEYPAVVRKGAIKMLKWETTVGEKQGIQSETISRHSVTYFNQDGDNTLMGYPKSLLGFLKPFMKARF